MVSFPDPPYDKRTLCTLNLALFPGLFEKLDLHGNEATLNHEMDTTCTSNYPQFKHVQWYKILIQNLENPDTMYKRKFGLWDAGSKLVYKTKQNILGKGDVLSLSNQSR